MNVQDIEIEFFLPDATREEIERAAVASHNQNAKTRNAKSDLPANSLERPNISNYLVVPGVTDRVRLELICFQYVKHRMTDYDDRIRVVQEYVLENIHIDAERAKYANFKRRVIRRVARQYPWLRPASKMALQRASRGLNPASVARRARIHEARAAAYQADGNELDIRDLALPRS